MQEILNPTAEAVETDHASVENSTPQTPQDQLTALINSRMGQFEVKINYTDLKYIKNTLNSKVEWKGPNEAYLVIMAILTLDATLESMDPKKPEAVSVKLPSSTLETINFLFNRITGKGIESAQKMFSISMQLRKPLEMIKKIDQEIETLQAELKTEKNSDSAK